MSNSEAFHVSPMIGFQTWYLDNEHSSVGWLEKSKRIWKATQNVVEFFNRDTGQVAYYWEYKRTKSAVICDVCEVEDEHGKIYYLTVIHSGNSSVVCLLNFNRLVKIIELPVKITAMCNTSGAATLSAYSLMSAFHGVASFGCSGGFVLMVDMQMDINMKKCLDEKICTPVSLREINPKDSPKVARRQLLKSGVHVYYNLNRHSTKRSGKFMYRSADGAEYGNFPTGSVQVTAVAYLSQTNSQAVGYNFGCFQIFSLHNLSLVFSSTINQANPLAAASHFVLQEPENDPRKYLFLWVGHSAIDKEHSPAYGSRMIMYQLAFEPRSGSQYGILIGCASKLELPLSSHPYIPSKKILAGSHLISCSTAPGLYSKDPAATTVDLTVMMFVWEAQSADSGKVYHIGVFDLNRWYYAQMPRNIRWEKAATSKVCSFVTFHSLSTAVGEAQCPLIGAAVTRVSRFYSPPPICESHLWPSSISFDITCVYSTGLQNCQILGLQEAVLSKFVSLGSSSMDNPTEVYSQCMALNLLPHLSDHHGDMEQPVNVELQRRSLLDLALERDFFSILYSCAKSWTTGALTTEGCTLSALLEWAWLKLMQLKQEKDELCQPLFDGTRIGDCLMQQLLQVHRSLAHLTRLFQVLLETSSTPMTEQGYTDLLTKCHGCAVHKNMLEVTLWCIGNKVVPQAADEGAHCLYYPLEKLKKLYTQLRHKKQPMESSYSLMVDILHDKLGCGEFMVDNGDGTFYPPASIEQLINIYATQNTSLQHCVMMYYLTDLNTMSDTSNAVFQLPSQLVASYAKEFCVPTQLANFAEGLWHLDHGSVEEAGRKLLCHVPTQPVNDVIFLLYPAIIRSFMDNDGAHQALKFASMFSSRDPSGDNSREKMLLHIDVLVAVGRLSDALSVVRKGSDSEHDLYSCFLDKCQKAKKLSLLVTQLLTTEEDAALCDYLEEHPSLCCLELLVMFHLQRSRYIDAIRTNAQLNKRMRTLHDPQVWERSARRNAIVDGFARALPACLRNLALNQPTQPPPLLPVPSHPQPMSIVVARESQAKVLSQAHYVSMVMQKVGETKQHQLPKNQFHKPAIPLPATPFSTAQTDTIITSEPFVSSPVCSIQRSTVRIKPRPNIATPVSLLLTSTRKTPQQQSSMMEYQDDDDIMLVDESAGPTDVSTAPSIVSLMEKVNNLKQLKPIELHECLRTPSMKKSPVINTSFKPASSLRLPPQPILKSRTATPAVTTGTHEALANTQPSVRKIRFAASMSPDSPPRSSNVMKGSSMLDSPVCISSGEDEEFYSPPAEVNKRGAGSTPKPFAFNFTADETDVVDLTATDDSPSESQAPETTQVSPPVPSPHIRLMDFLSPTMSPKDIATSLKQQHSLLSKSPDSLTVEQDNITSSVTEHVSFTGSSGDRDNAIGYVAEPDTTRQDIGVVAQYEVTARSPMNYNETASIRQISPPQDPSELKRAALLPLDERLTTDINIPPQSVTKSARVLLQKIDSPGSLLKASIARGTVSVRKAKYHQTPSPPSFKVSTTTSMNLHNTSNLTQGYKFSPPVQLLSPEKPVNDSQMSAKGASEHSPTMTFPFSPPLTRSQRRRTGSSLYRDTLTDNTTKVQLFSESMSEMSVDPVAADTTVSDTTTVTNTSITDTTTVTNTSITDTTAITDTTTVTNTSITDTTAITDTTTDMTTVTEKKDSSKKARISEPLSKSYLTRSRTKASPRIGPIYDTVCLHPMPTPGSTPAKEQVATRKTRQKSKAAHKPPLNLRRSSRLLDTDKKHK
ncbi:protein ELYS-like isoform X2 [Dysidea avara]|uniref:protein ELYS-like isoform X2 n=1 Tax=Dysidea avara TaxID=196820 RepID=UPI00332D08CD